MRISIDKSVVEFPDPGDFEDDFDGRADFERARKTAEDTVCALLLRAQVGVGTASHWATGTTAPASPEPPASVKRLAAFGAWCLSLSEREKNHTDAGRRLLGAADEFKAGDEVGAI